MLYLQVSAGMTPQLAGLMLVPMAILSVVLAPFVGRLADRTPPGRISVIGFITMLLAVVMFVGMMRAQVTAAWLLIPLALLGAANALCWSANSAIAMRQLPSHLIGAGSGVYNTSRQVGAAVGAAALGAAMQVGIETTDFAAAMGNSLILPAGILVLGLVAVANYRPDALQ